MLGAQKLLGICCAPIIPWDDSPILSLFSRKKKNDFYCCCVRFTKPVAVFADVGLFLTTGTRGARADFFSGGNGTYDVTFK